MAGPLPSIRRWPLRRKVWLILVVSSILPLAVLTTLTIQRERSTARSANEGLLQARVDQVGDTLEAVLRGYRAVASRAARDPIFAAYCAASPDGRAAMAASVDGRLAILRGQDPAVRGVGLVDRRTVHVVAGTERKLLGHFVGRREYVRRALGGAPVTSDVYVSVDATGQVPTVALAEPLRTPGGELVGLVVVWLRAQTLWDVMSAANGTAGTGSYFVLFDRRGIRIGHSRASELVFHPSAPLEPDDLVALQAEQRFHDQTSELLAGVVPFPLAEVVGAGGHAVRRAASPVTQADNLAVARVLAETGWALVALVAERDVEVSVLDVLPRMLPPFLLGLALVAAGAVIMHRQVVEPVRRLAGAAMALERGEATLPDLADPGADRGSDELAQLTGAFASMARTLAERERSIQASNRDLRLVLDNVGQGFLAMDLDGRVSRERSAAVAAWFGEPAAEEPVWEYLGRDSLGFGVKLRLAWQAAFAVGDPAASVTPLPTRLERGGQVFDLRFRTVVVNGRLDRVILVVTDVTEELARRARERTIEAELQQAQKLESVGRLAAGIAHEINTPLQYVSDSCAFLDDAVRDLAPLVGRYRQTVAAGAGDPAARADLASAEASADVDYLLERMPKATARALEGLGRVTTIVRAMKEFAHPDQKEMSAVDLNRAIASTLTIARNEYKYVADVATDFGPLPPVTCHAGEINQAVLNIVVNAAHAIGDVVRGTERRGTITVRTFCEGPNAVVTIADTGGGIPEAIRDRIYDPFFTTKEVGQGTGQGLWITRSVVCEKHGGELSFVTEAGRGTTFTIRLPVAGKKPAAPAPPA